ncbi:hypothetical protein [Clostridium rectalis]|uniref:hypothetical protein n=1 Tax=Clostridium rectalis TaxID=2040295 RepID=UPI000F632E1D|nr:hypothetical protein [Clostridium rectalis]
MMLNKYEKVHPYSFSREMDYMFVGEYLNNTFLFEFNPEKKIYNSVKEIDKNKLIRFGLVGNGLRTYFNALTGVFTFDKNKIEVFYKTKEKEYNLMSNDTYYNDIIYFKNAYSQIRYGGMSNTNFCGYNYGYKAKVSFEDGTFFYFKPIINIPMGQPTNFKIWLVSNVDLDGEIVIKVNNLKTYNIHAPLEKNIGGELTWFIRI